MENSNNLKIIAGTEEEFKNIQKAYFALSQKFILKTRNNNSNLFLEACPSPTVRTLENKFQNFSSTAFGVTIYPGKGNIIEGVFNSSDRAEQYSLFWFNAQKEALTIGLENTPDKRYLFEIQYNPRE